MIAWPPLRVRILFLGLLVICAAEILPTLRANVANSQLLFAVVQQQHANQPYASTYLQGVAAYRQEQYTAALSLLQQATGPSAELIRWHVGQVLDKKGDWLEALDMLNVQEPIERQLHASILLEHLPTLPPGERDRWELELRQKYPDAITQYAAILLGRQQFAEAEEWARLTPDYEQSVVAQLLVGQTLFYRSGSMPQAKRVFKAAHERFATAQTAYWYGRTLSYLGDPAAAISVFEGVMEQGGPRSCSVWFPLELAANCARVSRCEDAWAVIAQVAKCDSNSRSTQLIKETSRVVSEDCVKP